MALTAEQQAELDDLLARQTQRHVEQNPPGASRRFPDVLYSDPVREASAGLASSFSRTSQGAKDLMGIDIPPEDAETLARREEIAGRSGYGTAGKIGGDLAQILTPGSVMTKIPRLVQALRGAGKAAAGGGTVLADLMASLMHGGVKLPEAGENRIENALAEGGASLFGSGVGKVIGGVATGARVTPEAREILDAGAYLTPGRSVETPLLRGAENVMRHLPITGGAVKQLRDKGEKDWAKLMIQKAGEGLTDITSTGAKGISELKAAVKEGYEEGWAAAKDMPAEATAKVKQVIDQWIDSGRLDESATSVMRNVKNAYDNFIPSKFFQEFDTYARKRLNPKQHDLSQAIKDVRSTLRESMPPEAQGVLNQMDELYPKYLIVRKAANASKAFKNHGVFTPDEMANAARSVIDEATSAAGEGKLYGDVLGGVDTVGRKEPSMILDFLKSFAENTPQFGIPFEGMSKMAIGNTVPQNAMRRAAEAVGPYISPVMRPGPATAAGAANFDDLTQTERY